MKSLLLCTCLLACTSSEENLGDTVTSTARWALALGQRGYETTRAVAIDSHGDVLVAGTGYLAAADLGTGTIGNDSMSGWGFLTKRSAVDGGPMWTLPYASPDGSSASISAIAVDRDDHIVVTGSYGGTLSFGAGLVGPGGGMFVAKYTDAGTLIWLQTLSGATGSALGVDAEGNIFVGANYNRTTVDFMGTQHVETDGNGASMVVSYTPDGTPRWGNFFDAPERTTVSGLAISQTGDLVVTGSFSTTVSLGGGIMNPDAQSRGFVARYHGDGSFMWAGPIGPSGTDRSRSSLGSVTIDALDRIILQGDETSTATYDGTSPTVNVLDAAGSPQWTYAGHTDSSMPLGGLVTRADGTVVSSAWVDDVGTDTSGKLQLRLFDMSGNMATSSLGKRLLQAGRSTFVYAASVGPSGEIAVVGDLSGEVVIGQGPIESHGTDDTDALVVMIDP